MMHGLTSMSSTKALGEMGLTEVKASNQALFRIAKQKGLLFIGGLTFLLLVFQPEFHPPSFLNWAFLQGANRTALEDRQDTQASWNQWSTRAEEWRSNPEIQKYDPNWGGRQRMYDHRVNGSLWWDEKAAHYFISKLEGSQFPANCSRAHWIAHYDYVAGLMSTVHVFLLPLMFSMVRGHTILPISEPRHHPAFDGCGTHQRARNLQCFFNITSCNLEDDTERRDTVLSSRHEKFRTSWEELLMEEEDFFTPGGVTVVKSFKQPTWATKVCVGTSSFSSFEEAYNYHKLKVWDKMGEAGQVGVVKGYDKSSSTSRTCSGYSMDVRNRRVDMVVTALMSSWMLNRVSENIKAIAETIMSRYSDASGRPLWTPPVLGIHVRQTDKSTEDPYYMSNGKFRPLEDYASQMYRMEEEYGFQWPSIFIISDSGTAMETLMSFINGEASAPVNSSMTRNETKGGEQKSERFIMYDWTADDHLQDKYREHSKVPPALKYDMQSRFLATIYIMSKIADHAIVTYSSNVGRFIGEAMAANRRIALTDARGPIVTSLDYPWFWA